MCPTQNNKNGINHGRDKKTPVGGNLPVLVSITNEAERILSGKLTKKELDNLVGYCRYQHEDSKKEARKYFDHLDPDALRLVLARFPDRKIRHRIISLIEGYKLKHFIGKNPEKFGKLVEILISVAEKPEKEGTRDNFSLFDYACSLKYVAISRCSPDEYLDFLEQYTGVLNAFDDCDHYKAEHCLEEAFENGYWRKLFLFLRLTGAPSRLGITGYPHNQEKIFETLTEEDIYFIADISPKSSRISSQVLDQFFVSKQESPTQHYEKWQQIGNMLRGNPASEVLISHYLHGLQWDMGNTHHIGGLEFFGEFGRMAGKRLKYSNEISGLSRLRDEMSVLSGITLKSPQDSPIFQLLATCERESIGGFTRSIRTHLEDLPEIDELTTLVHHVEHIVKSRNDDSRGYGEFLSYLLQFRKHPESLSALETFSGKYPDQNALKVLERIYPEYESGWENNPMYDVAIKSRPKEKDFPPSSEGVSDWFGGAIGVFISLCRSGMSVADCENLFTRIHRSKDNVRTLSSTLGHLREPEDYLSFLSILTHRPKSFQKLLGILAPITERVKYDRKTYESLYENLSKYFRFTVWHELSDEELAQISGVGEGSYASRIAEKCQECGISVGTFDKVITGFSKAVRIYPDIRKHLDKFVRFEKELFDLETRCTLERVRKYYIVELKLPESFPLSVFEKEEIVTLLHILVTSKENTEMGGKLLLQVAKDHETGRESSLFQSRKNHDWLRANLHPAQKKVWLARNEKVYEITETDRKTDESIDREIEKFLSVARGLLKNISYKGSITFSSAESFCEALPQFLVENPDFDTKFSKDLKLQADSIKRILHRAKSRSVGSVKIYRETNPLRVVMMGDWVDGSCLASHSSIRNSYSVIANATEANKSVLYAEDEKGNIIGRVLMAINEDGYLIPFRVYTRGNPDIDMTKIFEKYLREFSETLGMPFGKKLEEVKSILGCEWYIDPVWKIDANGTEGNED